MEFIICCDLEGIHGVVGEPYKTLTHSRDYADATSGAALEINTVAGALFDSGATKVYLWDNHGGGGNIDLSTLDKRITPVDTSRDCFRGDFAKSTNAVGVIFLGYHAKEGTPLGVLAHTFSSVGIQYAKLGGVSIGELYVDTRIFADLGIKPMLHAGDDISIAEMAEVCPCALSVVTKYGKGRNNAIFRERAEVLRDLDATTREAVSRLSSPYSLDFPTPAEVEIRYTRAERAEEFFNKAKRLGVDARYGEDTHILHFIFERANQIPLFL